MSEDLDRPTSSESLVAAVVTLDAVISIDEVGGIVEWNEAATRLFGWSAEDALGLPLVNLIIPDRYRDAHAAGLARLRETGVGPILGTRVELEGLRRDRTEVPVELLIVASMSNGCAYTALIRDLTRSRSLEAAQALAHLGVFSIDLRAKEIVLSDEFRRFVGLKPDEVLPSLVEVVEQFIDPDDQPGVFAAVADPDVFEQPLQVPLRVRHGENVRTLSIVATVDRDSDGIPVRLWGTAQDVTAQLASY